MKRPNGQRCDSLQASQPCERAQRARPSTRMCAVVRGAHIRLWNIKRPRPRRCPCDARRRARQRGGASGAS
eukprot:2506779-Prymnesium_polylepis.2